MDVERCNKHHIIVKYAMFSVPFLYVQYDLTSKQMTVRSKQTKFETASKEHSSPHFTQTYGWLSTTLSPHLKLTSRHVGLHVHTHIVMDTCYIPL